MRAFICAYKFSRRIPVTKFIKPTEMPAKPMNEPINQDSNKNVMDEMAKMVKYLKSVYNLANLID